ncbi:MAG TPA: carboxypeptidase regulatory-like domain-containing protein, partial [Kofleriaceae bacterium]
KLTVTVRDDKGPLAGAIVRLEADGGDVQIVETGKDGLARAGTLDPGQWQISASADGHEPGALRARELHAGEVVNVELVLSLGGRTLTGTVTDATGGAISGARIDAAKLGAAARPGDAVASTLTGNDGKYKLTVAEGQLLVAASEPSYSPQSRFVEVGANGASADFQLVPGGVIEGVVRDEQTREPVPGATVIAQRDAPAMMLGERAIHTATTGGDGRFRIAGLRPGAYELAARATKRASRAPTIVGIGVAEQVSDVEIVVGSAPVVRGVVVDENGQPAPNVEVNAFSGPGDNTDTKADAKGAFVLEGLAAGHYMLMARSDQFVPAGTTSIELAGKDVDGVKITVRHGLRIKGHVEKRQICEVQLDFDESAMSPGDMPMLIAPVTTSPDGEFDVGPARAIAYHLSARCPSGEQGDKKIDAKPAMADVVIEVKPGASIAGKVVDGTGKPVAGVAVMATPTGGTERTVIVNGMVTSGAQALTNAAGAFELRGLGAAAYRLGVLDRGRPLPMKSDSKVTLTAVEHKTGVTLAVDRPDGVIRGVVTGADGKPIADAWVSLHQDIRDMIGDAMDHEPGGSRMVTVQARDDGGDTGGMPPALTDASGKFEIKNLPRVPWTVVAEAQAGKLRGRAARVVPDADIKLQALGLTELKGKVIAPGGMPASFQVELEGATRAQRSFASADGTFSFSRVDPGDYTVTITSSAGNGRATVKVVADQTATVEVTLAANAIVVGRLVDAAGKPVGGAPLAIIPDTGQVRVELNGPPLTSNPDGTFRLEAKAGLSLLMVLTQPRPTMKPGLKLEAGKTLDVGAITVGGPAPTPP